MENAKLFRYVFNLSDHLDVLFPCYSTDNSLGTFNLLLELCRQSRVMEDLYGKDVEDLVLRSYSLMYCVTLAKLFNY